MFGRKLMIRTDNRTLKETPYILNCVGMDITKVERIIAGLDAITLGADANQDGNINALDITRVERIIVGLD